MKKLFIFLFTLFISFNLFALDFQSILFPKELPIEDIAMKLLTEGWAYSINDDSLKFTKNDYTLFNNEVDSVRFAPYGEDGYMTTIIYKKAYTDYTCFLDLADQVMSPYENIKYEKIKVNESDYWYVCNVFTDDNYCIRVIAIPRDSKYVLTLSWFKQDN